jgi:hypothetical protein
VKQNKKAKICFVIYIAGFFFLKNFCYEVFAKQKKAELPDNHYCGVCVFVAVERREPQCRSFSLTSSQELDERSQIPTWMDRA